MLTLCRNAVAVIACTAAFAFWLWNIEFEITVSMIESILFYVVFGFVSYLLLAGRLLLRFALLLLIPVLAALTLEVLGFGDAAYPFIGVLFALPVSGIFLLAGILAALVQRASSKKPVANAS